MAELRDLAAAVAAAYRTRPPARLRYACVVWRHPWMWVGRRTWSGARVELADGRALTWYGPRVPAALAAFSGLVTA